MDEPASLTVSVKSEKILGVRVDDVTYDEALLLTRQYIESRVPHQIVTLNPEFVMTAQKDAEFRAVLNSAPLSLPDGIGLLLAGKILGFKVREQVTGTDFVDKLAALSVLRGYRMFLLGAAEGVAQIAAENLQKRHPGLQISGCYAGSPRPEHEEEVFQAIRSCGRTDILLVAYGAPAQDKWIARNLPRLDIPVGVGIGGVFDFFSGRVKRAPSWIRRSGLEWLYRLIKQPWRWKRQLALPRFALAVFGVRFRRGLIVKRRQGS